MRQITENTQKKFEQFVIIANKNKDLIKTKVFFKKFILEIDLVSDAVIGKLALETALPCIGPPRISLSFSSMKILLASRISDIAVPILTLIFLFISSS